MTTLGELKKAMGKTPEEQDEIYSKILMDAIRVCREYKPKLGGQRKGGYTLEEFNALYGSDPFYSWMGLDSPLLYAAHKAAGGMTSIYRQIGIGCQQLFLRILIDCLGLTEEEATWSYEVQRPDGTARTLYLDGRIPLDSVKDRTRRRSLREWMSENGKRIEIEPKLLSILRGMVFEVRQGYKSKDSKRQNADLANAAKAYTQSYLPVALILSNQIDTDIAARYEEQKWVILRGSVDGSPLLSTYAFCRDVLGYDLAGFFSRNSRMFKTEIETVLKVLLT